jgi:hypothetical protein
MGFIVDFLTDVLDTLGGPGPKRFAKHTLCCGALMWDLWEHAPGCAHRRRQLLNFDVAQRKWLSMGGDPMHVPHSFFVERDRCPECAYSKGHYGLYRVGKPCDHCGYIEKRV